MLARESRTTEREEDGHEDRDEGGGPQTDGQRSAAAERGLQGMLGRLSARAWGRRGARTHLVMPDMIVAIVRREKRRPTMRSVTAGLLRAMVNKRAAAGIARSYSFWLGFRVDGAATDILVTGSRAGAK